MKDKINKIIEKVLSGNSITEKEALELINIKNYDEEALKILFKGADRIREKFNGNKIDLCTIINVKSGNCNENCKYCAQSIHYNTGIKDYEFMDKEEILQKVLLNKKEGANKVSLVSSGRGINNDKDLEFICNSYKLLNEKVDIQLCASHGIITYEQALRLRESGVKMYHHNIESCKNFYNNICTTHSYEDRIATIKNVKGAGLKICSGGILGLGETRTDRVKMAFELKELNVDSIPINILTPIKGTPLENREAEDPVEIIKTISIFRYILPNKVLRYAGGRKLLGKLQDIGLKSGINGMLTGNFLTTTGSTIESDKNMIKAQGLELV